MDRKVQIIVAVILTVIVGAVFYYAFVAPRVGRPVPSTAAVQPTETTTIRNPLTGMPASTTPDFFGVSVMYDNFDSVKVRPGLEQAGIIYEALVEGGITRLMAVFDSTSQVKLFGPIRSVRPYFIDWASEYGGILMHVGGSPEALDQLTSSDALIDINQIGADESYFNRDETLQAPHNVFASFSSWLRLDEVAHVPHTPIIPWRYDENPPSADVPASQEVDITFSPTMKTSWAYNKDKNNYVRFVNGTRELFSNGDSASATNLVVIEVPTQTVDTAGRQHMQTLGKGPAQIYRNGQMTTGTWMKETRASRMRFIDDNQEEIALTPGSTWVSVVPSLDLVAYSSHTTK